MTDDDAQPSAISPTQRAGVRLGVDVGQARVGLAATDPDAMIATPVMTLRRDTSRRTDIRTLVKIARDRRASAIYVGLPLSLSGKYTDTTRDARDYAQTLAAACDEAQLDLTVRLVDERLSTVSASQHMQASGLSARDQKQRIDQAAAVEILTHGIEFFHKQGREPGQAIARGNLSTDH